MTVPLTKIWISALLGLFHYIIQRHAQTGVPYPYTCLPSCPCAARANERKGRGQ